jgi:hypothetical protein
MGSFEGLVMKTRGSTTFVVGGTFFAGLGSAFAVECFRAWRLEGSDPDDLTWARISVGITAFALVHVAVGLLAGHRLRAARAALRLLNGVDVLAAFTLSFLTVVFGWPLALPAVLLLLGNLRLFFDSCGSQTISRGVRTSSPPN